MTALHTLRDEAGALLYAENEQRKHLRHVGKAVDEGAWDTVQSLAQKLELGKDTRAVQFKLARQQLLELVEEGDGQRAFTFFTRRIKPLEAFVGRQQFMDLAYCITCRNVQAAALQVHSLRGWTVTGGRHAIFSDINLVAENRSGSEFWRQKGLPQGSDVSLEKLVAEALSFQLAQKLLPDAMASLPASRASSFITEAPTMKQRPTRVLAKEALCPTAAVRSVCTVVNRSTGHRGALCGLDNGQVLWAPCIDVAALDETQRRIAAQPSVVALHSGRVWGIDGSDGGTAVSVGGTTAVIMSLAHGFVDGLVVHATAELTAVALVPGRSEQHHYVCGTVTGDVYIGDLVTGHLALLYAQSARPTGSGNTQSASSGVGAVAALRPTSSGLAVFAAFKSGCISCIDVSTGVTTLQLSLPVPCELLSIALSPSSFTLAAAYGNSTVRLWDTVSGELLPFRLKSASVHCMTRCMFLGDKLVVATSADGNVYSWDLQGTDGGGDVEACGGVSTLLPAAVVPVASGRPCPCLSDIGRFDERQRLIVAGLGGDIAIIGN